MNITKIKIWIKLKWHELGVYLFWPKYQYLSDYLNNQGQWYIKLTDPVMRLVSIFPLDRNDVTNEPINHQHYNITTHNIQMGWLFQQFKLSAEATGTIYVLGKEHSAEFIKDLNKTKILQYCKAHDITLDKVIDVDVKAYFTGILNDKEKQEVAKFLSWRFSEIYLELSETSKVDS